MKKLKDFLLALILPRKMVRFRKLNFFLSFAIILIATYIAIGSTSLMAKNYVSKNFAFFDGSVVDSFDKFDKIDNFSIDDEKFEMEATLYPGDLGVYHHEYQLTTGETLDLTVVLDDSVNILEEENSKTLKHFDLEGYYKQEHKKNTKYILLIYTKRHLLYINDLGKKVSDGSYEEIDSVTNPIFEKENGEYVYYLPKDESEIVINEQYPSYYDTTKWTRKVSSENATIDFEYSGLFDIKPVKRHNKIINEAIYSNYSRCYLYSDIILNGVDDLMISEKSVKDYFVNHYNSLLSIEANNEKAYNSLIAFLAIIFIPIILVFITWIFFKGYNLTKFREYFAIFAITYASLSVLSFILGFFIEYFEFFVIWWICEILYYFLATIRINLMKEEEKDQNQDGENKEDQKEELNFKNIKDSYSQIG